MTDKELIKQEIERLKGKVDDVSSYSNGWQQALRIIEIFIDSLPEESGCEVNFTTKSEDLEEAMELSVSEEPLLEFFATGQPAIGAYGEDSLRNQFEAGAKWQKQQMKESLQTEYEKGRFDMREEMMKDAVECIVEDWCGDSPEITIPLNPQDFKAGNKVKIIICKTEQQ